MYIPPSNDMTDKAAVLAFMQRFSFATIVTAKDNFPTATHLPFMVTGEEENIMLTSHFAKANPQWQDIEQNEVLVIFSEPHAYISPKNYEKELNVPTWNYISVHCYGKASVITDPVKALAVIEATINNYESSYKEQWDALPETYKSGMMKGIVAFEITVKNLQAKEKLSQNKTRQEQRNIVHSLSQSADSSEKVMGTYMQAHIDKTTP